MNISQLLTSSNSLCVIGCSDKPGRAGHDIPAYMRSHGFSIIPVNPNITSVFGKSSFPSIIDVPPDFVVDIVVIFRNPRYTQKAVSEIVLWAERTGQKPVIWTQLGVSSPAAEDIAAKAGLEYVENACIAVEYAKYKPRN